MLSVGRPTVISGGLYNHTLAKYNPWKQSWLLQLHEAEIYSCGWDGEPVEEMLSASVGSFLQQLVELRADQYVESLKADFKMHVNSANHIAMTQFKFLHLNTWVFCWLYTMGSQCWQKKKNKTTFIVLSLLFDCFPVSHLSVSFYCFAAYNLAFFYDLQTLYL